MRFPAILPILALPLAACTGDTTSYQGHKTYEYFPLDGTRTWLYTADVDVPPEQINVDYNLAVATAGRRTDGALEVVTLEYRKDATGDLLYSIDWSSSSQEGILVYGYAIQGGESVSFDTPIEIAAYTMASGDVAETTSNGVTVTSELTGLVDCPNYWTTQVWECLEFVIDDGDGDADAGVPFAGTWQIARSWGPSRFQPTGIHQDWVLSSGSWTPDGE